MKKDYLSFTRILVGSHKYSEGSMGPELAAHQRTLGKLSVEEALKSINEYANTYQEICCLYACVAFIMRFPEANAHLAFSPEPNPFFPMPNRASSKVVLVLDGKVTDLVSMIGHKEDMTFEELLDMYSDISISDYCKKSLLEGESLTVLPYVNGHEKERFMDFFFSNPAAEEFTL